MALRWRDILSLSCIILLLKLCEVKAYLDVCESHPITMYCNCNQLSYKESTPFYRVSCVILQDISIDDPVWRSLGNAESISDLKIYPILPLKFEYIPSDELRNMKHLKRLQFQEGSFGSLKPYTISDFESLVELDMSSNDITALEVNAISNLPKLKKLALSENKLEEILADSLNNLLELEMLFLDRNNISRIETCAFCNLQNLKELELWGNQISDLTEYTFRGLRYLTRLDLYKNKIRILNDKVFHSMPRLRELDLKENLIDHIASRAFYGLEKLQVLSLSSNKIKVLPDEAFLPLVNLRSLDLYRNEIEVLQNGVMSNIKNSKHEHFFMSLKENPLKCDCRMKWISSYTKKNISLQFKRELEGIKCASEIKANFTVVEFLNATDCKVMKVEPQVSNFEYRTKSTDSVPIELQSRTYLSDSESISQSTSGCCFLDSNVYFIVLITLMSFLLKELRVAV